MTVNPGALRPRIPVRNRGGTANHDTSVTINLLNDGITDDPRGIVKIHIDALRASLFQCLCQIGLTVIDGGIEAEFFHTQATLSFASGYPDCAAALLFGKLTNDGA